MSCQPHHSIVALCVPLSRVRVRVCVCVCLSVGAHGASFSLCSAVQYCTVQVTSCVQETVAVNKQLLETAAGLEKVAERKEQSIAKALGKGTQALQREQDARLVRDKALLQLKVRSFALCPSQLCSIMVLDTMVSTLAD